MACAAAGRVRCCSLQPRLVAYQADGPELQYTYSGQSMAPEPWGQAVARVKVGERFHSLWHLASWAV